MNYKKKGLDFQIKVTFYWIDDLEGKIEVMEMIDNLDCNDRVSEVDIRLYRAIQLTTQFIGAIILRFRNLFYIGVLD